MKKYMGKLTGFFVIGALAASMSAHAQFNDGGAGDFTFTGIVEGSNLAAVTVGSFVTGTYVINLTHPDLDFGASSGLIASSEFWNRESGFGSASTNVFSSTTKVDGLSFADGAQTYADVAGQSNASAENILAAVNSTGSNFEIYAPVPSAPASVYNDLGLPVFNPKIDLGMGTTGGGSGTSLFFYSITSITPVKSAPEISSASAPAAFTLLFGMFAVLGGRRAAGRGGPRRQSCPDSFRI